MAVLPTHGQLQDVMQLLQRQVRWNKHPPPDRRIGAKQSDLDLIDFLRLLNGVRGHIYALFDLKMRRTGVRGGFAGARAISDLLMPARVSFRISAAYRARGLRPAKPFAILPGLCQAKPACALFGHRPGYDTTRLRAR